MKKFRKFRFSPAAIAASAILSFIALQLLVGLILRNVPSDAEACVSVCAKSQRSGVLVPKYSHQQTAGTGGKGPMECRCL